MVGAARAAACHHQHAAKLLHCSAVISRQHLQPKLQHRAPWETPCESTRPGQRPAEYNAALEASCCRVLLLDCPRHAQPVLKPRDKKPVGEAAEGNKAVVTWPTK